jgi:hypothetical protein
VSHKWQHPEGQSRLHYTVEHEKNVVSLDQMQGLKGVNCSDDQVSLHFASAKDAEAAHAVIPAQGIVLGGRSLGCMTANGQKVAVVRRVQQKKSADTQIILATKPAGLTDVLRNANATLVLHPEEMADAGSCSSTDVMYGTCTASLSTNQGFSGWRKDYSQQLWGNGPLSLSCSSCYVSFQPSVSVNVQIVNNQLTQFDLTINGHTTVHHEVSLTASASYSTSGSTNVGTINLPSAAFYIGAFPVTLDFQIPVNVGFTFNANAKVTLSGGMQIDDDISGGIGYNGGLQPHWSHSLSTSSIGPSINLDSSADLQVYVQPTLDITFEHICTLGIQLQPYLEFSVSGQNTDVHGNVYAGLATSINGNLGLELGGVSIGPQQSLGSQQVSNDKRSVWSR